MGACGSTNNNKKSTTVTSNQRNSGQTTEKKVVNNNNKNTNSQVLRSSPPKRDLNNVEPPKINKIKFSIKDTETNTDLLNSSFNENILLKDIFSEVKCDKNKDYDILDGNEQNLNNKLEMKIKDIFSDSNINLKIKYSGLDIPENIKHLYAQDNKLIGSLILDNLEYIGIFILDLSSERNLKYNYPKEKFPELSKFSLFSGICNAKNNLYISGGEKEKDSTNTEFLQDFYMIDLSKVDEGNIQMRQLPNLLEPRTWHSMIYIPNKYIFIVGGNDNKNVELYNMENNTIQKDSELNEARSECSLCMVNDYYLYAFCGFLLHQTFVNTIERCNLRRQKRKWEIVNYTLGNNIKFNPSFFGVGYLKDKILLLGANENSEEKNKNYILTCGDNLKEDYIEEFMLNGEYINVYREKLYIPINDKTSVNIPLISNDPQVFYLDNEEGKINKKEFHYDNVSEVY